MNMNDNSITQIAELKVKRFNQSYTIFKNNIYISCGTSIKEWASELSLDDTTKIIKDKESKGHFNPLRL